MRVRALMVVWLLLLAACDSKSNLDATLSLQGAAVRSVGNDASALSETSDRVTPAHRIVSLTPGLTELIYAVGAESSLVGTVAYADYPEAAKQVPRIGDAFHVDMEALLALHPDLVLAWTSGTPTMTVEHIKALGLRVVSMDMQHLSDISATLLHIGELTGKQVQAQQAAQTFAAGVQALRTQYAGRQPLRVFIEVNRQPLYTVNGQHIISEALGLCGGINVFADLSQLAPVVGVESVLKLNPDVILSTDGDAQQLRQDWQAWRQLNAVKQQHIYAVSPDTTTRATPRLLQGAQEICQALQQAR